MVIDLDHVRDDLKEAEGTDPVRAVAVLPEGKEPPFEPDIPTGNDQGSYKDAKDNDKTSRHVHVSFPLPSSSKHKTPHAGSMIPASPGRPAGIPATPGGEGVVNADGKAKIASREGISRPIRPSPKPAYFRIDGIQRHMRSRDQPGDARREDTQFLGTEDVIDGNRQNLPLDRASS